MAVPNPAAGRTAGLAPSRVRASVADFTWPATTPGRVEVVTGIPGGGTLAVAGTVRPPPANTQLELRLANLDLAPWARMLPVAARLTGVAEANLRMNEPLASGVPARVQGVIAVNRPGVSDGQRELLGARRIEAHGLELHWPRRLVIKSVLVSEPRGVVERDRAGNLPLASLLSTPPSPAAGPPPAPSPPPAAPPLAVEIAEVAVKDGRLTWRDTAVSPAATLAVSGIEASVAGVGWPLRQPLGVRLALRPPGGGHLGVSGRVGLDPLTADVRVVSRDTELAPYQSYLPTAARLGGAADADLVVVVPPPGERRVTVRGSAALTRVDVRDGERTVARVERASATGVELDWPGRLAIDQVALVRPWLLIERDRQGGLPLRTLMAPAPRTGGPPATGGESGGAEPLAVSIKRLVAEEGGARIVDNAVSPPFAVDLQPATLRAEGFSTRPGAPVRVDLQGRVAASAELAVRGTVGVIGAPLRIDLTGELREFAVPRTNPYLAQQVGWQTREGRLTTALQCRIEGDALSARTDIRLSRLQLARAASHDEAQTRIGLPLGLITTLMKDKRGDITLSFPVGGRLSDPRFDFRDAIWGAVRTVAVNAITLPVSWIGRVQFTPDSRIERIQVDPIPFAPGTPTLTPVGDTRVGRLVAFLDQLPSAGLALMPTVSPRDAEELRRRTVEVELERVARQSRLSREDAAARVFTQHNPGRAVPDDPEAIVAALVERVPTPTAEQLSELATQRVQTVRAAVARAGVDAARLTDGEPRPREGAESQIEIEVREPDAVKPSKIRETLRKLGVPLPGADADK
jgi:Domain of Unknown Function (DUF748)